ncbi:hypothetical protein Syun_014299 [Stephania yunnanensis]|uniref:Uncharacterized protein n=1 Tax=Stephania yunnanensis TaxID=152371 RepID=A0AAP0JJB1_9MAGN
MAFTGRLRSTVPLIRMALRSESASAQRLADQFTFAAPEIVWEVEKRLHFD